MTEQEQKAFEQMREALKQVEQQWAESGWGFRESIRTTVQQALTAANAVSEQAQGEARACEIFSMGEWCLWSIDRYEEAKARGWQVRKLVVEAAQPQATEPAWRPIETAPKDGSEILLAHSDGSMVVGWWREARSHGRMAGWSDGDDFAMTWPSHWKPKPAAPEAKQ